MKAQEFYNLLLDELPKSTTLVRQTWAAKIMEEEIELNELSNLLFCEPEVTSRFMWLLTEVGEVKFSVLFQFLPHLLEVKDKINYKELGASFANYWLKCGVPEESETQAIDLLFSWVQSGNSNATTKSRSIFVLYNLTKKYPALKNELRLIILDQMDKNTKSFATRAGKMLKELES